jgi:hypothetical protein
LFEMNWQMLRMSWRMRTGMLTRRDVVGIFSAIALLVVFAALAVGIPASKSWTEAGRRANWNFGPEWECQTVATPSGGTPICFKKLPPPNSN